MKPTLPSATIEANVAPQNTLVIEPMRINVSPSGSLPLPLAISPKPRTTVSPLRVAPITKAGGLVPR